MEIRVAHTLDREKVIERLASAAGEHGVEHTASSDGGGSLAYDTPLGRAAASYTVEAAEIVVVVTDRPAFLPEGMVRRTIEEKLREFLAG